MLAGIEKVVNEAGYNLIISQSLENEKKEITNASTMFNSRVDGLLVSLAYNTQNINHFNSFLERNIPIIFFDRVFFHEKCNNIVIDNFKAAYEMTEHLINQGCKRILHVTGDLTRNVYGNRFEGFKAALEKNGIPLEPSDLLINSLTPQAGIDAAYYLLKLPKLPDAVFVINDTCACSCMVELKKHGIKIPSDILIAGFNNDFISTLVEPNLTTVNYNGFEVGETAAQSLIHRLTRENKPELPNIIMLRHELIIRQSSLKPIIIS
jgi:LacI family transcriptional regulator